MIKWRIVVYNMFEYCVLFHHIHSRKWVRKPSRYNILNDLTITLFEVQNVFFLYRIHNIMEFISLYTLNVLNTLCIPIDCRSRKF